MPSDMRDALDRGAPKPRSGPDLDVIFRGAERLRSRRRIMVAVTAVAVLAAIALVIPAVDLGDEVQPVGPNPVPEDSATFSPEPKVNSRIAFVRSVNAPGEPALQLESTLFTVKPDGTGESRLVGVDPYSSLAWSPDGSKIAFGRRGIRVLSLGTGEVTTLCETPCRSPAWSPDGKSLAFIRSGNLNNDLWIMDADGSEPRDLLKDAELAGSAPAWSPDGKLIAVILEGDSGDGAGQRILLVDASTGEPVREIVTEVPSFVGGLSWFPDATRITFDVTSSSGGDGIYVVSRDGTGLSPISSCSEEGCSDRYPSVSPDGMRITFTRARCDEPGGDCSFGDIMVMSIDGTDLRSVTSGDDLDCCPAWQPLPSSGRAERD